MAKGPLITGKVKQLIAQVFLEKPGLRAKEIQAEVSRRMNENGGNWPSLSVVEKLLVDIRKRHNESITSPDNLDAPWHMGILEKYPVSPEAIPYILKALWWGSKNFKELEFTIRQAKWAARLYGFESLKNPGCLYLASFWYAHYEKICELSKADFDTRWFDDVLDDFQKLQNAASAYNYQVLEKMFNAGIENSPIPVPHKGRGITIY